MNDNDWLRKRLRKRQDGCVVWLALVSVLIALVLARA
jgi:hypothetical protein